MRAVALGRENYLFVGSEVGGRAAAIVYALIEMAKLNGVAWCGGTPPYAGCRITCIACGRCRRGTATMRCDGGRSRRGSRGVARVGASFGQQGREGREGDLATPVLGAPRPGGGRSCGVRPVLLDEPGEARVRGKAGGLAVVFVPSRRATGRGGVDADVGLVVLREAEVHPPGGPELQVGVPASGVDGG